MIRSRRAARLVEPSRPRWRVLLAEGLAGLAQRPGRSLLTMFGTVVGVGAFVAVLGLTSTAGGQISAEFSVLAATQVSVDDQAPQDPAVRTVDDFPADADARVERLNGVVHAGVWWQVSTKTRDLPITAFPSATASAGSSNTRTSIYAATPEALAAMEPTLALGTLFNGFHDARAQRVVVLSAAVAAQLGITQLDSQPAVFIAGVPYTVVGVVSDVQRLPEALLGVVIPDRTAVAAFGRPSSDSPPHMLIETRLGAARLIASQAALALRPEAPNRFKVVAPPDAHAVQDQVTGDLNSLFLLLAGVTLVIGMVGITNTTLVSVLERTQEIGLRRSLGARPRHIALQILGESTALGLLGGLVGTALGVLVVVLTAIVRQWTAVLDQSTVLPAPLIGALVGFLAGLYPAWRAGRIEPVEALRR